MSAEGYDEWKLDWLRRRLASKKFENFMGYKVEGNLEECISLPDNCPILGCKLQYGIVPPNMVDGKKHFYKGGMKGKKRPANLATLDRLIPEKGYVPGNVFVISDRANRLKNNATLDEILAIAKYIEDRLGL